MDDRKKLTAANDSKYYTSKQCRLLVFVFMRILSEIGGGISNRLFRKILPKTRNMAA
jgi:hypothetical protein